MESDRCVEDVSAYKSMIGNIKALPAL